MKTYANNDPLTKHPGSRHRCTTHPASTHSHSTQMRKSPNKSLINKTRHQQLQSTGRSASKLTESLSSSLSVCILCLPASLGRCSSINFMLSDRPLLHSTWLTDHRLCQWKIWLPGELDRLFEARRGTTWQDRNAVDDNAFYLSLPFVASGYTNPGPGGW